MQCQHKLNVRKRHYDADSCPVDSIVLLPLKKKKKKKKKNVKDIFLVQSNHLYLPHINLRNIKVHDDIKTEIILSFSSVL